MVITEDGYSFRTNELHQLVFEVAGATSVPFMEDNPEYVVPSERIKERIDNLLQVAWGIEPTPPISRDGKPANGLEPSPEG